MTLTTVCGIDRAEVERRGAMSPPQFQVADLAGTAVAREFVAG